MGNDYSISSFVQMVNTLIIQLFKFYMGCSIFCGSHDHMQVSCVDEELLRVFAWSCAGTFPPLSTTIGGVVAQEALIAVTGKFTPLRQWVGEV